MNEKKIKVTIKDTLAFYNDYVGDYVFNPENSYVKDYFYDVPESWLVENHLTEAGKDAILGRIYGENWRAGNGDGSRYQILEFAAVVVE